MHAWDGPTDFVALQCTHQGCVADAQDFHRAVHCLAAPLATHLTCFFAVPMATCNVGPVQVALQCHVGPFEQHFGVDERVGVKV